MRYSTNKYHSKKTVLDGIKFDSKKEAKRYAELKILASQGLITDLRLQVPFVLIPTQKKEIGGKLRVVERDCRYVADFVYEENGQTVVEDTKGVKTPDYIIKRKLMLYVHGIEINEV